MEGYRKGIRYEECGGMTQLLQPQQKDAGGKRRMNDKTIPVTRDGKGSWATIMTWLEEDIALPDDELAGEIGECRT